MSLLTKAIKNVSNSPRGFHDANGLCVVIQPGATKDIKLTESGLARVLRKAAFEAGDKAATNNGSDKTIDELKADAEALGIEVKSSWGIPKLTKEIARVEAENAAKNDPLETARAKAVELGIEVNPEATLEELTAEIEDAVRNANS